MKRFLIVIAVMLFSCVSSFALGVGDGRDGWWRWDANSNDFQCYAQISGEMVREYCVIPHVDGSCHVTLVLSKLVPEQWAPTEEGKIVKLRLPASEMRIGGGDMIFSRMMESFPYEASEKCYDKVNDKSDGGSVRYILSVPAK